MKPRVFLKNILTLSGGKALASLFTIVITPFIARLFTPEDFGVASFFLSIVTILITVSSLRYANAVVLPKLDLLASRLVSLALIVAIIFCAFFEGILVMWGVVDPDFVLAQRLGFWVWLLPIAVLLFTIDDVFTFWLVRVSGFKRIAVSDLAGPIGTGSSRLAFGYLFGSSVSALLAGLAVGRLMRLIVIIPGADKWFRGRSVDGGASEIVEVAKSYSDYPRYGAPTSLVFVTSNQLPLILLGFLYDPAVLGFYAMANRLLQSPIQTVSGGVRKVFLKKTSDLKNQGKPLTRPWVKLALALGLLGLAPFGILMVFAEEIMILLLGEGWRASGEVVAILVPWLFLVWISLPCAVVVEVYRKQKQWFRLQILTLILRASVFALAYYWEKDYIWAISGFVAVSSIAILVNMGFLYVWTLSPPLINPRSEPPGSDGEI